MWESGSERERPSGLGSGDICLLSLDSVSAKPSQHTVVHIGIASINVCSLNMAEEITVLIKVIHKCIRNYNNPARNFLPHCCHY